MSADVCLYCRLERGIVGDVVANRCLSVHRRRRHLDTSQVRHSLIVSLLSTIYSSLYLQTV